MPDTGPVACLRSLALQVVLLDPSFFHFDNGVPLSKEELKELIYEEVTRPLASSGS